MNNLSDNEIIKALECCVRYKQICPETCPMVNVRQCKVDLRKNTLDLINRLQAENERLKKANGLFEWVTKAVYHQGGVEIADFPTVEARNNAISEMISKLCDIQTAKVEGAKEFAERLKEKAYPFPCAIGVENAVTVRAIDDLKKEMVGEG